MTDVSVGVHPVSGLLLGSLGHLEDSFGSNQSLSDWRHLVYLLCSLQLTICKSLRRILTRIEVAKLIERLLLVIDEAYGPGDLIVECHVLSLRTDFLAHALP